MPQFRSRHRGATLLDIIIPTSVYIILAAMLIPIFGRARKDGRRRQCQSNLQQIVSAVSQYMNDNDGYYPAAVWGQSSSNAAEKRYLGWADTLQPYMKSIESYQCPEEANGGSSDPASSDYVDYWYNPALSWNGKHGPAARWNSMFAFENESQIRSTVMMGDAGKANGMGTATSRCNGYECSGNNDVSTPSIYASSGQVINEGFAGGGQRHLDGLNIAFADGHIKWFNRTQPNSSKRIYNLFTPFKVSGDNPTFNLQRSIAKPDKSEILPAPKPSPRTN
jgi:prepilin-type processing-associated H-X9-DG protein